MTMRHDGRLPWRPLTEIAYGMLGIAPEAFWAMTPCEWMIALNGWKKMHGLNEMAVAPVRRAELDALARRFPDGATAPGNARRES